MTDDPKTAGHTVRETFIADGLLMDKTFAAWSADLRALARAQPWRYGPDPIESCGSDCWRSYYDNGYTATSAWAEDGTYD